MEKEKSANKFSGKMKICRSKQKEERQMVGSSSLTSKRRRLEKKGRLSLCFFFSVYRKENLSYFPGKFLPSTRVGELKTMRCERR